MSDDLFSKVYNPDVLSCLANLSSDEVFTSPQIVNEMLDLLPQELFENPDTTFLDPACKTGVFLREIAKRLIKGLENQIPDLQERVDHIFKKQLYGIAITELTSLLTRRSLYCSKYPNSEFSITQFRTADGNIRFKRIDHVWEGKRCKFCGAPKAEYKRSEDLETHAYEFIHTVKPEEIFNMKFDVIISNPPYHLNDGGGTGSSAVPIYQLFVEQAKKLKPKYLSMIVPSRWFAGGKGLDEFRHSMLDSNKIRKMVDYANSADCFPGVTIAGGICYFLWDRDYFGECEVINCKGGEILSSSIRSLGEYDVFIRDNSAIEMIRKIKELSQHFIDEIAFSRNSFNLFSKEKGHKIKNNEDLVLYSLNGKSFISKMLISDRDNLVDKYKVIMTKAMSGGNKPSADGKYQVISSLKVLKPGEVCTETYLCLGGFDNLINANNLEAYMKTKFFRFFLLQALTSINISKEKFAFIPLVDLNMLWNDEMLCNHFQLTETEKLLIENTIKSMEN